MTSSCTVYIADRVLGYVHQGRRVYRETPPPAGPPAALPSSPQALERSGRRSGKVVAAGRRGPVSPPITFEGRPRWANSDGIPGSSSRTLNCPPARRHCTMEELPTQDLFNFELGAALGIIASSRSLRASTSSHQSRSFF